MEEKKLKRNTIDTATSTEKHYKIRKASKT